LHIKRSGDFRGGALEDSLHILFAQRELAQQRDRLLLALALTQRPLILLAFGDVARDLGEADKFTAIGPQRVDHHAGHEPAAVRANPPTLFFIPVLLHRDAQHLVGLARGSILRRVEDREVLADDVVGAVSLDALGAYVPGQYTARSIEHEDGVVADAFDQMSKEVRFLLSMVVTGGHENPPRNQTFCPSPALRGTRKARLGQSSDRGLVQNCCFVTWTGQVYSRGTAANEGRRGLGVEADGQVEPCGTISRAVRCHLTHK
jgi:hypothetical protein